MVAINMIDISGWQKGLDLKTVFNLNPELGGVIVKSSGGVSGVQETCDPWVQWLIKNNKPWGFYHFIHDDGKHSSGKAEAEFWVKNTKSYFGKGMPWADYEAQAANRGTAYLKEFLDTVYELTGIKAGVYCSLSVVQSQDFNGIASFGYPLWVAQYADLNTVYGFLASPWQRGSVAPFDRYVMHQYTSSGRLNGWGGRLYFVKYFGTAEDWANMLGGSYVPGVSEDKPQLKGADPEIVKMVLNNEMGVGDERIKNLKRAGYDPDSVQRKINELYSVAVKVKPLVEGNKAYLSLIAKIAKTMM